MAGSAPLRVLFINDTPRNGGPGRSLYTILKFLPKERVHRSVLLPRPGLIADLYREREVVEELLFLPDIIENPIEPWSRSMVREDFDAPLPLRSLRAAGNVLRGARGAFRLAEIARRGRYDLLYCNGTNANFFGGFAARLAKVPAIWHVRYTSLPAALMPVHDALAAQSWLRAIVCVSEASRGLFSGPGLDKTRVVHNALDVDEFRADEVTPCLRSELGLPGDAVIFGSQGRVLPRKGYLEMIEAARRALAMLQPDERERCHFVVVGDTPEDLQPDHLAECRQAVERAGLGKHVHFIGFRADVRPYVADFTVGVVPSVYPDPLPRAVIENMAFRKPVLAFDVGGVGEMLAGGQVGRLLGGNPADVPALAQAFVDYFRDPALCARQGLAARERIEQHYDARAHSAKILACIEAAVAPRAGTA